MYIPAYNQFTDHEKVIGFMQQYSFATIVSVNDGSPVANHLPFLVEQHDGKLFLSSHFAKANPQSQIAEGSEVLVIFTEPHAYISPKHYEKVTSVPTWNYMAVHAYGKIAFMQSDDEHFALLEKTIQYYEKEYQKQWDSLPADYRNKMIKGIVGFEIEVDTIEAKSKLSQNRTDTERDSIIKTLSDSPNTNEQDIARYMRAKH